MSSDSPPDSSAPSRSGTNLKIALTVALVAFLGACWLLFNWNAARELAAAKAEWNASGPALKFGEKPQDSPVVPDDKNILRAPVFSDWNRPTPGTSANPAWEQWAKRIEASGKEPDPFTCDLDRLFRPVPGKAGKKDTPAALADAPGRSREAVLIAALERDLPELKTIPAEFAARPEISLGFRYTTARALWSALPPSYRPMKNSALVLAPYAVAQARAGDPHIAARVVLTGLRYENALLHAYTDTCSSFARLHFEKATLRPLHAGLLRRAWSEAELRDIQHALLQIDFPRMASRNSANGMVVIIDMIENMEARLPNSVDAWAENAVLFATPKGLFDIHHAQAIRRMRDTIRDGIHSDGAVNVAAFKTHAAAITESDLPWNFAAQFGSCPPGIISSAARVQTYRHCALLACAIERHRLASGKLPAALSDIPADILKNIPVGTTTALHPAYSPSPDGGYTLTYAREKFCDDSGNELPSPGDVVWSMPAAKN